jgi:hypothetical protein
MKSDRLIRFRFAAEKALSAIHWMANEQPSLDLHTMLKSCYFADQALFNKDNRPVFGATYRAMKFGPVPLEIYEMAKGEPIWLAQMGIDRYPWRLEGFRLQLDTNQGPDLDVLSAGDFRALKDGFELSRHMNFTTRTAATHGKDWQAAKLGMMRYEDMIEDETDKAARVADLVEAAPYMRL